MTEQRGSSQSYQDTPPPRAKGGASPDRLLLTVEEAAFRCSLSRSTMYELIGAGLIRSIIVGSRSRRVVASDLERWITEQTAEVEPLPRR